MKRAATILILLVAGLAPAADAHGAVRATLSQSGLTTPREHPLVRVRLAASEGARVRLRLVGPHGRVLARSRGELRLRRGGRRAVALPPSTAGLRTLGRCTSTRVALIVDQRGAPARRVRSRTVPDPIRCAPLNWPPPRLSAPETIALGTRYQHVVLRPDRDYVLKLPPGRKLGGTFVEGGRNVVLVGGRISLPPGTTSDQERRALYFKGQTGTVHVEGVLIDGTGGGEGDAIALNAPAATVQIENVRVDGIRGSEEGTHADVVQPWGGVRELRIDRLTGISRFQGLQLPLEQAPIGTALMRYVNLRALTPTASALGQDGSGGTMLWLTPPGRCDGYPVGLREVWIAPRPGRTLADSVWPEARDGSACAAVLSGSDVRWPGLPVRGSVRGGAPAGGDYVPGANVGEGYRSPGYAPAPPSVESVPGVGIVVTATRLVACRLARLGCAR
jgi:hypothetical protein